MVPVTIIRYAPILIITSLHLLTMIVMIVIVAAILRLNHPTLAHDDSDNDELASRMSLLCELLILVLMSRITTGIM